MPDGSCEPFSSPVRNTQADVAGLQFLGEQGELDAAAEPFVFVDDEGDGDAGGAELPASFTVASGSGRLVARVEISSGKTRVTPASASESGCASRDWSAVEARAYLNATAWDSFQKPATKDRLLCLAIHRDALYPPPEVDGEGNHGVRDRSGRTRVGEPG
jgi:hypothetical protein